MKTNQKKNTFLSKNLTEIKTFELNEKNNNEFLWLKKAIGNSKIVMLGEQDHGDATAFVAKARIIKYLHEEMEFNVLAFESDFYQCNQKNELFREKTISIKEFKNALWDFWTADKNIQKFYNYLEECNNSSNPINITGFDCQYVNLWRNKDFAKNYLNYFKKSNANEISSNSLPIFEKTISDLFSKPHNYEYTKEQKKQFLIALDDLIKIKNKKSSKNNFSLQELKNLKGHASYKWSDEKNSMKVRDRQMADNLKWLYEHKFKNEKIIIWAHNGHIPKDYTNVIPKEEILEIEAEGISMNFIGHLMGELLYQKYGNDIYSLGFISYSGNYSHRAYNYNFEETKEIVSEQTSLEYLIHTKNIKYGFINLKETDKIKNIPSFIISDEHNEAYLSNWKQVYDGLLYIDKMLEIKNH